LKAIDEYSNTVLGFNKAVKLELVSGPEGEILESTTSVLVNGECTSGIYLINPGVYKIKFSESSLGELMTTVYARLDEKRTNKVSAKSENGDIEVLVSSDTFDKPVILEIVKNSSMLGMKNAVNYSSDNDILNSSTKIELTAKDAYGEYTAVEFKKSAELTMPYPDKEKPFGIADGTQIEERNLRLWYYDIAISRWVIQPVYSIDMAHNTITAQINKLGLYAVMGVSTDIEVDKLAVYPNPFADSTRFVFSVGSECDLKLDIYTLAGRHVRALSRKITESDAGDVTIEFDGKDNQGEILANGTYIYKITTKREDKNSSKLGKLIKSK
jgi:hypothetical protein